MVGSAGHQAICHGSAERIDAVLDCHQCRINVIVIAFLILYQTSTRRLTVNIVANLTIFVMNQTILDPFGCDAMLVITFVSKRVHDNSGKVDLTSFVDCTLLTVKNHCTRPLRFDAHNEII